MQKRILNEDERERKQKMPEKSQSRTGNPARL